LPEVNLKKKKKTSEKLVEYVQGNKKGENLKEELVSGLSIGKDQQKSEEKSKSRRTDRANKKIKEATNTKPRSQKNGPSK